MDMDYTYWVDETTLLIEYIYGILNTQMDMVPGSLHYLLFLSSVMHLMHSSFALHLTDSSPDNMYLMFMG